MKRLLTGMVLLSAAACAERSGDHPVAEDEARIDCALTPDAAFERNCRVERMTGAEGLVLTLYRPDGGFRRLLVTQDGRGVVAADGAEQARITIIDEGRIEVALGEGRYRLPATVGAGQ